MTFINEYISIQDIEKYQIKAVDKSFLKDEEHPQWTIDRDRDIYLRYISNEREELSNRLTYYFFWKGSPIVVTIDAYTNNIGSELHWHYELRKIDIPPLSISSKDHIIDDLKEALKTHGVRGVYSNNRKFTVNFDF